MAGTDDDAWLDQLRDALASTGADRPPHPDADPFEKGPQLSAHPGPNAQPAMEPLITEDPAPLDDSHLREALVEIARRIADLEGAVSRLADDQQAPAAPSPALLDIAQIEATLTRVVRAEIPAILDARSAGAAPVELTDDRRQLVNEAVGEIRKLLFGE